MKISLKKLLLLLLVPLALAGLEFARRYTKPEASLERSIERLHPADFYTCRRAQREICSHGKSALPRLRQVVLTSGDGIKAALCCYLIGDIDAKTYANVLLEAASIGRVGLALQYPNRPAIESLSGTEREDLAAKVGKLEGAVSPPEFAKLKQLINGELTVF